MMIADIGNSFYHPIVRAAQDVAHRHRYDVMIANTDHIRMNEEMFCESLIRRPVDGVIMVPYHLHVSALERLMERTGVEIAVLGQHIDHPSIDVVYGTDDTATYDAVRWLIQTRRHRRIGFIGVTLTFPAGERRQRAYLAAMTDVGLETPSHYICEGDWSQDSGHVCMRQLMSALNPPTAVLACNDNMAIGAILAAQEMNLRVPDDIAVVGFDNIPAASWIRPRMTTIAQFPEKIGHGLAGMLFERLEGIVTGPGRRIEVSCRFIERESA